jgi:hypothetical protein
MLKRNQARGRIDNCLSAWVEKGYSIRDLLPEERWAARINRADKEQADAKHSPMPFAELPSTVYRPAEYAQASHREEIRLIRQANNRYPCFCDECARKRANEAERAAATALRFARAI